MSRLRRVAGWALLVLLVSSGDAYAWLGGGWFERLSGPGPFGGFDFDIQICRDSEAKRVAEAYRALLSLAHTNKNPDLVRNYFKGPDTFSEWPEEATANQIRDVLSAPERKRLLLVLFPGAGVSINCVRSEQPGWTSPVTFATNASILWSTENRLSFAPEVVGSDKVRAFKLLQGFDFAVNEILDVGVGTGLAVFWGDRFDTFTKWIVQPIRLTLFPLAPFGEENWNEMLYVEVSGDLMLFGFKDVNFGAIPGTYDTGTEWVWDVTVSVDVTKLRKKKPK